MTQAQRDHRSYLKGHKDGFAGRPPTSDDSAYSDGYDAGKTVRLVFDEVEANAAATDAELADYYFGLI